MNPTTKLQIIPSNPGHFVLYNVTTDDVVVDVEKHDVIAWMMDADHVPTPITHEGAVNDYHATMGPSGIHGAFGFYDDVQSYIEALNEISKQQKEKWRNDPCLA